MDHRKLEPGKIVVATYNAGKVREIKDLLAHLGMTPVSVAEFDLEEPEETEDTFVGNALIKARAAAAGTGMVSLADDSGLVSGLAWKFGAPDRIGDWVEPGAFKSIKLPVPMLFGHDMNDPIGTWDIAEEKSDGLHITGKLLVDDVARAREVRALVKSGAVRGISIGFITKASSPRSGGGRSIKSLELLEASLVTIPMHPGARKYWEERGVKFTN